MFRPDGWKLVSDNNADEDDDGKGDNSTYIGRISNKRPGTDNRDDADDDDLMRGGSGTYNGTTEARYNILE